VVSVLLRITDSDYPFVFRLILLLERKIVIIVICVLIIVSFAVNQCLVLNLSALPTSPFILSGSQQSHSFSVSHLCIVELVLVLNVYEIFTP
jgi:hypothetical protein